MVCVGQRTDGADIGLVHRAPCLCHSLLCIPVLMACELPGGVFASLFARRNLWLEINAICLSSVGPRDSNPCSSLNVSVALVP